MAIGSRWPSARKNKSSRPCVTKWARSVRRGRRMPPPEETEMTITNPTNGTSVHEIADRVFRISTPVSDIPGGFMFNQFLIVDEAPLLYHTGPRRMFPLVREAIEHVLGNASKLRYVGFSHVEADECGSLNEWLALAP